MAKQAVYTQLLGILSHSGFFLIQLFIFALLYSVFSPKKSMFCQRYCFGAVASLKLRRGVLFHTALSECRLIAVPNGLSVILLFLVRQTVYAPSWGE